MMIKGSELHKIDKKIVLAAYVHRYTGDHKPLWRLPDYKKKEFIHFRNDREWMENTFFHVTMQGRLDKRFSHCESHPTFPYKKGG